MATNTWMSKSNLADTPKSIVILLSSLTTSLLTTEKILPDVSFAVRARCEHKCPCRETVILTKEAA